MTTQISWLVELALKPGQLESFCVLTGEMVTYTQTETGVLADERVVSEDGTTAFVDERETDSAAAAAHLRAFGNRFGERSVSLVQRKRLIVCGDPSVELRRMLDDIGVT